MSLDELNLDQLETESLEEADVPDPEEAGPALLGRKPVLGSIRREQGVTVVRDEIAKEFNL